MGSGLGLSTVRKLAQLYGGDASVKSEKGTGSIFTVTLRDAALPDAAQSAGAVARGRPGAGRASGGRNHRGRPGRGADPTPQSPAELVLPDIRSHRG